MRLSTSVHRVGADLGAAPTVDSVSSLLKPASSKDFVIKAAIVVVTLALLVSGIMVTGFGRGFGLGGLLQGDRMTALWLWPGIIMGIMVAASYIYRTALWLRYKPLDGRRLTNKELPTVTVVIPAYNEGPMVKKSILSAVSSRYPADKLQVICVDDGSKDDTFVHMEAARKEAPGRITTVRLPENRGKRHALYAGMSQAKSQIIVTLDSDSVLPADSLRNIVAPFVKNRRAGAVAGCVKVLNRYDNVLTRMLGVRYLLGFEFTRAYQSVLKTVFCCPGALTAYRREVIAPHLDGWLNQTFLGNRCTNGDDHAMTNVVLRAGYDTLYQSNADVMTIVPTTYKRLSKMYTRWARSNIRESWMYLKFATRRARQREEWLAWVDGIVHALTIPARMYLMAFTWYFAILHFTVLLRSLAAATLVALLYVVYFLRSERSTESLYGILYSWFALLTLQWIYPWAGLTVSKNRWMTRG
ncbi:MAG: glycosyltransferase family 2 protein [Myxococcales bacterium]|nr:glycosyltransferase family 2 protein [Myxococcales bacterium]